MYVIKIPEAYQETHSFLLHWLYENFTHGTFKELYYHEPHKDGLWHTHCKYFLAYIEFKNEEDAAAFKLYCYDGIDK